MKAIVTGNTRGIGRAISQALTNQNICIYSIIGRSSGTDLMTVDGLNKVIQLFEYDIDILVHNFGGGGNIKYTDYKQVMYRNYEVMVKLTEKFLESKKDNNFGRVIAISSIYGKEFNNINPYFNAAKSAQIAYMKSMSKKRDYVRKGITFNCVAPGIISCGNSYEKMKDTDLFKTLVDTFPMGKIGMPEDVAAVVKFLCSKEASFINGVCITVDGGQSNYV